MKQSTRVWPHVLLVTLFDCFRSYLGPYQAITCQVGCQALSPSFQQACFHFRTVKLSVFSYLYADFAVVNI